MRRRTRIVPVLLAAVLLGMSAAGSVTVSASADTSAEAAAGEKPESELTEEEKQAKAEKEAKEKALKEAYELPVQTNELKGWPEGPGTYGDAAIVMDADSGAVLYAKNIEKKEYPASITKVLTALLAFRYSSMTDQVTISQHALDCLGAGYASIGLKEGNVITMEQALYATLLASANEAACAVGETVAAGQGQDYDWFLEEMNRTVTELGGVNSSFVNTNGVFDENHYTCALDMALIGKALFDYPQFFTICQTAQYQIPASETVEEHVFQQKHHMLLQGNTDYYEYAIGGKTGYTTEAENTLITMADNGSRRLICVVLKTYGGHPYSDTRALLEYGFREEFRKVSIAEQETEDIFEKIPEDAYVLLPEDVSFRDLDYLIEEPEEGSRQAMVTYYYDDIPAGSAEVTLAEGYNKKEVTFGEISAREEDGLFSGQGLSEKRLKALAAAGIAAAVGIVALVCAMTARISRKRRRRRRNYRKHR